MYLSRARVATLCTTLALAIGSSSALAQSSSDNIATEANRSAQQSSRSLQYNQARQQQFMNQSNAQRFHSADSTINRSQRTQQLQRSNQRVQQTRQQLAQPTQPYHPTSTRPSNSSSASSSVSTRGK
ncbi:hypothetical protein R84981_002658 [Carnimonas sp. R-84981]|uniref:hypothetical protein n=1 Tax=Carnimonas bestiolae TaxID=3402172 RepID=UPI003EDC6EDE